MLNRRAFAAALPLMLASPALAAAPGPVITIYKTASCGCCRGWITTMQRAGWRTKVVEQDDVSPIWRKRGVPDALSSCHVSEVGGYVVVGHVPPADIVRLLKEKPKALGLTVPGMPWGSPGMERPDGKTEAYDTLLLLPGGKTRVFARHA
ncbi:DUF411 domain-containing protein [Phenylobacterium sp.]|jgi:hypothetical protein|uniref:DUF411 domain-containing protein n=1 Tax=Phenylobacterium sp. TaxID=1871053 RepID=UPI002F945428